MFGCDVQPAFDIQQMVYSHFLRSYYLIFFCYIVLIPASTKVKRLILHYLFLITFLNKNASLSQIGEDDFTAVQIIDWQAGD